jgi:transaldolase/glucose-6-phosphate isomerase
LWIEQLVAESTGKNGVGILPVTHAALPTPAACEPDRVFLGISLAGEEVAATEGTLDALEQAGHPVVRFALPEPEALGGEFLRWEIATATAGTILGVNPFDEPDVSAAKRATADLLDRRATAGGFPTGKARASTGPLYLFTNGDAEHQGETTLAEALSEQLESGEQIGYVAVLGFSNRPGHHVRVRTPLPPLDRAAAQGRTRGRTVLRSDGGSGGRSRCPRVGRQPGHTPACPGARRRPDPSARRT